MGRRRVAGAGQHRIAVSAFHKGRVVGRCCRGHVHFWLFGLVQHAPDARNPDRCRRVRPFMIPLFGVSWSGIFLGESVTVSKVPECVLVLTANALITGFNSFGGSPPEP